MSGGSGSGGGFVPSKPISSGQGGDPCNIVITIPLSAVNPAEAVLVKQDDLLDVRQITTKGTTSIIATNPQRNNAAVGSIAFAQVETLIECIESGVNYQAKVLECNNTSVKVKVYRID